MSLMVRVTEQRKWQEESSSVAEFDGASDRAAKWQEESSSVAEWDGANESSSAAEWDGASDKAA